MKELTFIVLEGPDKVGKTTYTKRLSNWYTKQGYVVTTIKSSDTSDFHKKKLMSFADGFSMKHYNNIYDNLKMFDERKRDHKAVVILDRHLLSTAAQNVFKYLSNRPEIKRIINLEKISLEKCKYWINKVIKDCWDYDSMSLVRDVKTAIEKMLMLYERHTDTDVRVRFKTIVLTTNNVPLGEDEYLDKDDVILYHMIYETLIEYNYAQSLIPTYKFDGDSRFDAKKHMIGIIPALYSEDDVFEDLIVKLSRG